jgi:PIN domain nuclease of toxin-antitoxin system
MPDYVLDASALLALLNAEKGVEIVQDLLPDAVLIP